ncbi:MAG: FRG domain-containing protein [Nitrospira sp.]
MLLRIAGVEWLLSDKGFSGANMNGQWLGEYSGTSKGRIILNVDDLSSCFGGVAFLHSDNVVPSVAVGFHTQNKDQTFGFRTDWIHPIDRNTGIITPWGTIKTQDPNNVIFSSYADVRGTWNEEELTLSWSSEIGNTGSCVLQRSKAGNPSSLIPSSKNWEEYKTYVSTLEGRRLLFRGQKEPWRLRTSFHRSGRADLMRFWHEDRQVLHRHLSARTNHVFNLDNPSENGAFFNLIQHHGYPTRC